MAEAANLTASERPDDHAVREEEGEDAETIAARLQSDPDYYSGKGYLDRSTPRPKDTITLLEAQSQVARHVSIIFQSWLRLRYIIGQRGRTIQKRWSKKMLEQRRQMLLAAWPGMTIEHRPDLAFMAHCTAIGNARARVTAPKYPIHMPHINLTDLARSKLLLLLLESRASCFPDVFANADLNSMRIALKFGTLRPEHLGGHTMHLTAQRTLETYGRITSWKDDEHSAHAWLTGSGVDVGEGLSVLRLQSNIFRFLVDVTRVILHDTGLEDPMIVLGDDISRLVLDSRTGLETAMEVESLSGQRSLIEVLTEAPYRVPDQFDFSRLHTYVKARRDEAGDTLWLFREDPAYFAEMAQDACYHQADTLLRNASKIRIMKQSQSFWEKVLTRRLCALHKEALMWDALWQSLQDLESHKKQHEDAIVLGQALPQPYQRALTLFAVLLERTIEGLGPDLLVAAIGCKSFRYYMFNDTPDEMNEIGTQVIFRPEANDPLWFLLGLLLHDERVKICGIPTLVDEIQRLIESDRRQRDRLSPRLAAILSDFSVIGELERQLALSSPSGRIANSISPEEISCEMKKSNIGLCHDIYDIMQLGLNIGAFGLQQTKFCYPIDKRRTAASTMQLRSAEHHLDAFWTKVDQHFLKHSGQTLQAHFEHITGSRELSRTPEWTEPLAIRGMNPSAFIDPWSHLTLVERTEATIAQDQQPAPRLKAKRRGDAGQVQHDQSKTSIASDNIESNTVFEVPKKHFRVFCMFFRQANTEGVPGELPWNDLLQAMASIGFGVKKLNGSAWLFSPADEALDKSIIFHEPHPSSKISFQIARRCGRRLTRTFGWTSETFVRV